MITWRFLFSYNHHFEFFSVPTERVAITRSDDLRGLGICHQQAFWQEYRKRIPAKIRNLTEDRIACEFYPEFGTIAASIVKKPLLQAGRGMSFAARSVRTSLMFTNQGKRKKGTNRITAKKCLRHFGDCGILNIKKDICVNRCPTGATDRRLAQLVRCKK